SWVLEPPAGAQRPADHPRAEARLGEDGLDVLVADAVGDLLARRLLLPKHHEVSSCLAPRAHDPHDVSSADHGSDSRHSLLSAIPPKPPGEIPPAPSRSPACAARAAAVFMGLGARIGPLLGRPGAGGARTWESSTARWWW